jgi:hypothetical protein
VDPGQGLEPRSPRSERGVLPFRRSRSVERVAPPSISSTGDRRNCESLAPPCHATPEALRCFLSLSPTLRPWIVRGRPSYVEGLWSPALDTSRNYRMQKQRLIQQRNSQRDAQRAFLSQAGPRFDLCFLQAEHHLGSSSLVLPSYDEGDPFGSPSLEAAMRLEISLARAPPCEGLVVIRPPVAHDDELPARIGHRGRGGFRKQLMDVGCDQHWFESVSRRSIDETSTICKWI